MSGKYHTVLKNGIVSCVIGLASVMGVSEMAVAASDYKVISKHEIKAGDWDHHQPTSVIRFYLPENFDWNYAAVLQMNIRSTNKSRYNAIYLNPGHDFRGCEAVQHDRFQHVREFLPHSPHKHVRVFHKIIEGERLKSGTNELVVCARDKHGETQHNLDNFYLSDIVLHYRKYEPAPQFCSSVFEPVCGTDGRTYGNECEARAEEVEIHYGGQCDS